MSHNARPRFVLTQRSHSTVRCSYHVSIGVKSWSFCLGLRQRVATRRGGVKVYEYTLTRWHATMVAFLTLIVVNFMWLKLPFFFLAK